LEGSVVASGAAGFTMDCAGTPVEVTLAGLKDFGVESTGLVLAPPVPGSRMQVSGTLVAVVDDGGAKRFLLRPLSSESMRGLLMTSLWQKIWQNRIVREVAPACFCTDPGGPHR
jgi:hypothetical protein